MLIHQSVAGTQTEKGQNNTRAETLIFAHCKDKVKLFHTQAVNVKNVAGQTHSKQLLWISF